MPWVYMLECADGSYYVGSTNDLQARLDAHRRGLGAVYTRSRLPVELLWSHETEHIGDAFWLEKRIQGWSRAKREALVRADFDLLRLLAKRPRVSVGGERADPGKG